MKILLHAAALRIELDPGGQSVAGLRIRGDGGREAQVRARAFVLCGGGIENPRLMLASANVQASGVGNGRGLVGRFFQDHPSALTGIVATDRPYGLQDQFRMLHHRGLKFWPKLAFTDAAQRRGKYLNANALTLCQYAETSPAPRVKALLAALQSRSAAAVMTQGMRLVRNLPELAIRGVHTASSGLAPVFKPTQVMLKAHVEQVPDPESRVTLADARDRFGVPRARLSWRLHEDELRTMRAITVAAGRELQRLGLGEMKLASWLDGGLQRARGEVEDTYHHAGTTRMATTAAQGVVDPTCRVFGLSNLYVAGSSVFPTSGYANPTLTIVALAIRLADELRARIIKPPLSP